MKKPLIIALAFVGLSLSACSDSKENKEEKKPQTETSDAQIKERENELASDTDTSDPTHTPVEVVEKVDEEGNVVRVATNKETGEEIVLDDDLTEEEITEMIEKIEEKQENVQDVEPDFNIHEYAKLNTFLGKYVTGDGHVKYASIKSNKSELDAIIEEFEVTSPEASWSKNQKLAFWINAYNIFTIKLIVDNYPTTSITKITAKPWDKKFANIGGKTYTLNNIETDIIRKKFNEPRIHFALNCASKSCPILLNKAYKSGSLDSQLTSQTKKFLNDTSKNTFSKKEANISQIFDWYKDDFGGSVMDFIKKYHPMDYTPKKTSYMEYSWELNK